MPAEGLRLLRRRGLEVKTDKNSPCSEKRPVSTVPQCTDRVTRSESCEIFAYADDQSTGVETEQVIGDLPHCNHDITETKKGQIFSAMQDNLTSAPSP